MFVDRARVKVSSGSGGNGCICFRREKYVPRGGPDGGDGGDGGDIIFAADASLSSLLDLQYHSTWRAKHGVHGKGKDQHGKKAEPLIIAVPLGTVVRDADSGEMVAELLEDGQQFLAAPGGRGGKGNARFTHSTRQAPRFAEKGEPGETREYLIELKLIAELGLVGLPNAGKSTFLAACTAATPKIADYPFTTLSPNLGVAHLSGYRVITIADIPGIIDGASEGKGLGHDFLRHIERTRVLVFIIDLGDPDPVLTLKLLRKELEKHSPVFAERPQVIALNKADIPENKAKSAKLRRRLDRPLFMSAATGDGVTAVLERVWEILQRLREEDKNVIQPEEVRTYAFEAAYTIESTAGGFRIEGKTVLRMVQMTNFDNEEAVRHLHRRLKQMGVFRALKRVGALEGQTILIGEMKLEYQPD